jgi:hypothetical protein
MLKQRIRHHLNFVKANVFVEFCQTCGQRGGDEMNGVTACSEFLTEFGSNNAATAVGRINRDADVHLEEHYN